jgi:hypothetical protein
VVTAFVCALAYALPLVSRSSGVATAIPFFLGSLRRLKDEPDEPGRAGAGRRCQAFDVSILIASVREAQFARQTGETYG